VRGQQVNGCKMTSDTIDGSIDDNGKFSVGFYFTPDCSGTRAKVFRFTIPQGSQETTVACEGSSTASLGVDCKIRQIGLQDEQFDLQYDSMT